MASCSGFLSPESQPDREVTPLSSATLRMRQLFPFTESESRHISPTSRYM